MTTRAALSPARITVPASEVRDGQHHVALYDGETRVRYAYVPAASGCSWVRLPATWAAGLRSDGLTVRVNGRLVRTFERNGEARAFKA